MPMLMIVVTAGSVLSGLSTIVAGAMVIRLTWAHRGDKAAQGEVVRRSGWYPLMQLSLALAMAFLIAQNLAIAAERGAMDGLQEFAVACLGAGFVASMAAFALTCWRRARD